MDLGNITLAAIAIAICVVPFVLLGRSRKKKQKRTLQSLINLANQENCNISKHEICSDFIIGIDETKRVVFFFKKLEDKVVEQFINLAEIQNCKIKKTTRTVAYKNESQNVIDKLELLFIPFDKNKKEISLEFYDTETNLQLSDELQLVEQWTNLINSYLKK